MPLISGTWDLLIEKKGGGWPAVYYIELTPLVVGPEGEEGIYCDNPADAVLMAAAPELLAACRDAENALWEQRGDEDASVIKLREAIAKATKPVE